MTDIIWPYPTRDASMWRRIDQGQDLQVSVGTPVLAVAAGTISYAHDATGFGDPYPVLMFFNADLDGDGVYYGHQHPEVADGVDVVQGQQIATASPVPGGNAFALPGWLELGWWRNGPTGNGQAMHDALIAAPIYQGEDVTPADLAQIQAMIDASQKIITGDTEARYNDLISRADGEVDLRKLRSDLDAIKQKLGA